MKKKLYSARNGKSEVFVIERHLRQAHSRLYITFRERFVWDPDQTRGVCIIPTFLTFILCPSSKLYHVRRRATLAKYLLYSDLIAFDDEKTPKVAATVSPDVKEAEEKECTIMHYICYSYCWHDLPGAVDTRRALISRKVNGFFGQNARVQCTIIAKEPRLTLQSKLYTDKTSISFSSAHYLGFVVTEVLFACPRFSVKTYRSIPTVSIYQGWEVTRYL